MKKATVFALFIVLVASVLVLSAVSVRLWGSKSESSLPPAEIAITLDMTVQEIADTWHVEPSALKRPFGLQGQSDLAKTISDLGLSVEEAAAAARKAAAIQAEEGSKNWVKILAKFVAWFVFLGVVFVLMRRRVVTPGRRKTLLVAAVLVFGVVLGSDPSPMGTVKDAIALYGAERVIFPPRLVAFLAFLAMTIFANKFICSWGCQLGVLQDLIFRINRDGEDRRPVLLQWKPPFALSNTIRAAFLAVFTFVAFAWARDIIAPVDPFTVFKPASLSIAAGVFVAVILVMSLFTYRPWCHFFCPFGLVGWLAEKASLYRVKVDYDTCIACGACAKACPSTVMGAILKRDKRTIPDCFACGTCIGVCPTKSISFARGRRDVPPEGKFAAPE